MYFRTCVILEESVVLSLSNLEESGCPFPQQPGYRVSFRSLDIGLPGYRAPQQPGYRAHDAVVLSNLDMMLL